MAWRNNWCRNWHCYLSSCFRDAPPPLPTSPLGIPPTGSPKTGEKIWFPPKKITHKSHTISHIQRHQAIPTQRLRRRQRRRRHGGWQHRGYPFQVAALPQRVRFFPAYFFCKIVVFLFVFVIDLWVTWGGGTAAAPTPPPRPSPSIPGSQGWSCLRKLILIPSSLPAERRSKSCVSCWGYCCCGGGAVCWFLSFTAYSILYFGFINSLRGGILDAQLSASFLLLDFRSVIWIHFKVGSHKSILSFFLLVCIVYPNGQNQCLFRRSLIKVCSCFFQKKVRPLRGPQLPRRRRGPAALRAGEAGAQPLGLPTSSNSKRKIKKYLQILEVDVRNIIMRSNKLETNLNYL